MLHFLSALCILTVQGSSNWAEDEKYQAEIQGAPEKATFAGGCFWCMEHPFDVLQGVISTTVGYIGGDKANPTYEEVSSGGTGHAEAVEVLYDPSKITYEKLLDVFWHNINPNTLNQQFADMGDQYRTAIFTHNDKQKKLAKASKDQLEQSGKFKDPIVTKITPATPFYQAEEYHQDYYEKNASQYKIYRAGSGRDHYLKKIWSEEQGDD